MLAVERDREQPHEAVKVGERWFAWGYHWDIKRERDVNGVREVLTASPDKPRKSFWVPAWRMQRYGRISGDQPRSEP